jgi:hypothetical protein
MPLCDNKGKYLLQRDSKGLTMSLLEKLCNINVGYIIVAGIALTALLFKFLLQYAEEGNLVLVILLGLAIGFVATLITRVVKNQRYLQQLK